jgi:carbohydrate kinase (thermoresistant glucokinase family)
VLLHDTAPDSWECRQAAFEGEGGLHAPDALREPQLAGGEALYEVPAACLQYRIELAPGASQRLRFAFGPARDEAGVRDLRARYLHGDDGFERALTERALALAPAADALELHTPDAHLDAFVQPWLCRQALYLGEGHRFCTDPQTRNYLQDAMGLGFLQPQAARAALLRVLEQQEDDGGLPDGILLHPEAELKYINQIPHSDHALWLPICLASWLQESGDYGLLQQRVRDRHGREANVAQRVEQALHWLLRRRDGRGLSLIGHGDWCDPMNMVGPLGHGVSGWLSIALIHALRVWAGLCDEAADLIESNPAATLRAEADALATAVQTWLWDGDWFARGITDGGRRFGVRADDEGRIFLNPQAWSLLADLPTQDQRARLLDAVDTHLQTPSGLALCDPPFTRLHEDIGRVTQKFPGSAENGSVYSHAVAFHINGLYAAGEGERAYALPPTAALRRLGRRPRPRPAAELSAQLLPRRPSAVPADRRPQQPAAELGRGGLAAARPAAWAVRSVRRTPGPALRTAAASGLGRGTHPPALPRQPAQHPVPAARGTAAAQPRRNDVGRAPPARAAAGASLSAARAGADAMSPPRLLVCMGVSGCGKSTLASALSARLDWPLLEGDDYHSDANRAHMAAAQPLSEAMREPWLASICSALRARSTDCVLACSALRRSHRARLRALGWRTRFLLLEISPDAARQRLEQRSGHFMPASLVDSQLETLEWPLGEADVSRLDAQLPLRELVLLSLIETDRLPA